jgi:predicted RND superfamily exporter protein
MKALYSRFTRATVEVLAHTVAHRTKTLILFALLICGLSIFTIASRKNLDSEVLNLLPGDFQSVQGLKEFNSEFAQGRQLVFALVAEQGHAEDLEAFRQHFVSELRKQPWVLRTFDRVPLETEEGLAEVQSLVPYLLLNLPENEFRETIAQLDPQRVSERLTNLRAKLSGDSIRSQMEVQMDPLGLFARAMKPFAQETSMDQGSPLASSDNLLQIALAILNQPDLGAPACQAIMNQVHAFREKVVADWDGYKPQVLVTGRTAYVAEISQSMARDAAVTSTVSILMVSGLFFLGFRRVVPLIGICLILSLSALVALAVGMLIFKDLNMIAIGFCSILVGVGDDFSLLLFGRFLQGRANGLNHRSAVKVAIRDVGPGIFYVILTTGIGFLALNFSQSAGFAQLGTLVSLGVAVAGLFMILFLFLFFRGVKPPTTPDFMLAGTLRFVRMIFREPRIVLGGALAVLVLGAVLAISPAIPLKFDTDPRSLEPKSSKASIALQTISTKLRAESDPMVVLVKADNAQQFHDRWERLSQRLKQALADKEIKYFSSPVALTFSPARFAENREILRSVDIGATKQAAMASLEQNGFAPEAFQTMFGQLDRLEAQKTATTLPEWPALFPEKSSWWFFLERYLPERENVAVAYVRPTKPITSEKDQQRLATMIHAVDPQAVVTGWTFTLFDLVPWAKGELVVFTAVVGVLILVLLAVAYRRPTLWLVHASSLTLAMLALVASLKLLQMPINLLNVLAFPLVLAVGVDYGMHVLIVGDHEGDLIENLANVLKPLCICGLTTVTGFGSLALAVNPALSGLGIVCALGVLWCLLSTLFFVFPAFAYLQRRETSIEEPEEEELSRA